MTLTLNQLSVGTTASFVGYIPPAGYLTASGSASVYLGTGSAVTTGTGYQMTSAAPVVWQNALGGSAVPVYAIASATAQTLSYSFGTGPAGQVIIGGTAAVQLNHSAANIQPTGIADAAGSTGLAADSGHVHMGLSLVAATSATGYPLANGTATIISWTAPNDGNQHRILIFASMTVTSTETGGLIQYTGMNPDGTSWSHTLFAANSTPGDIVPGIQPRVVKAGSTESVIQASALTGGTATCWAEIWGS
jgi:hypothetical protein